MNEIDIIAVNDDLKTMLIAEVKRNDEKINSHKLKLKATKLLDKHPDYDTQFIGYSLKDM